MRSIDMINAYIAPAENTQPEKTDLSALSDKMNDIANTLDAINLKLETQKKRSAKTEVKKETEKEVEDNGDAE